MSCTQLAYAAPWSCLLHRCVDHQHRGFLSWLIAPILCRETASSGKHMPMMVFRNASAGLHVPTAASPFHFQGAHAFSDRIEAALREDEEHMVVTIHMEPEEKAQHHACLSSDVSRRGEVHPTGGTPDGGNQGTFNP
jgi:hypothetical protein